MINLIIKIYWINLGKDIYIYIYIYIYINISVKVISFKRLSYNKIKEPDCRKIREIRPIGHCTI